MARKHSSRANAARKRRQKAIDLARQHPDVPVSDISSIPNVDQRVVHTITIGELASGKARTPTPQKTKPKPRTAPADGFSVAREHLRAMWDEIHREYEEQVLQLLTDRGEALSAGQIRAEVGGYPDKVAKALGRLIEEGKVSCRGRLAGAKYWAGTGKPPPPARQAGRLDEVRDVRSKAGRDRYDKAILGVLVRTGEELGAREIRRRVGGTRVQMTTALNRLIERGKVTYTGYGNATRYAAV